MKHKMNVQMIFGMILLGIFVLFTLSLKAVDLQPAGPEGSLVAYAGINKAVHDCLGVNMLLCHITDWAGVFAICVAFGFGVLGLCQWIKRRKLCRVDGSILALGVFYLLMFGAYAFFEIFPVNYRPVLIDGVLEASYPSSTTVLVLCVMLSAMLQFQRRIRKPRIRIAVNSLCGLFAGLTVTGRLFSGVHWLTDIVGGMLFSGGMVLLYGGFCGILRRYDKTDR